MYAVFYDAENKLGYHGIAVKELANEVSLSSIPKGEPAVAYLLWNMEVYSLALLSIDATFDVSPRVAGL